MDIRELLDQETVKKLEKVARPEVKRTTTSNGIRITRATFPVHASKPAPQPQGRGWRLALSQTSIFEEEK